MKKQEMLGKFIEALLEVGWTFNGHTKIESYRSHSFAFGGGPIITTGGRQKLEKDGLHMTVGLNTICLYRKPDNPETITGQGRMAGRKLYTFRDWQMQNIEIKRADLEDIPKLLNRIAQINISEGERW